MTTTLTNRTALMATGLLSLVATLCLAMMNDNRTMHPDIAQAISAAKNLLDGKGFSTSLIYYEQHYQQNTWPAAQTVFPIGFPAMIAGLGAVGVPFRAAAQLLSLTGFFIVPVLICLAAIRMGRRPSTAVFLALLWQCSPMNWHNVYEKQTETLFVTFTLSSLILLQNDSRSLRRLMLAGLFAMVASSLRYAGVFWLITGGVLIGSQILRDPKATIQRLIAFGCLPAILVGGMFIRNSMIVGDPRGGISHVVDKSIRLTLENVYYAVSRLTGLDQNDLVSARLPELFVAVGACGLVLLAAMCLLRCRVSLARIVSFENVGHSAVYGYIVVTLACLAWLEKTTSVNLSPRMILPLIPFGLLAAADIVAALLQATSSLPYSRKAIVSTSVLLTLGLALAQPDVFTELRGQVPRFGIVKEIIEQPLAATAMAQLSSHDVSKQVTTVRDLLAGQRILTNESHMLPEVLEQGAIGLSESAYTSRVWTSDEVQSLAQKYDVQLVVVFTGILERDRSPFFDLLMADKGCEATPSWLEPVLGTQDLIVFQVKESVRLSSSN